MISLYTETLEQYLARGGNIHKDKFDILPTYTVGSNTYNMYDLFIERNKLREIGTETEEMFDHYLSNLLDEINIRYSDRIKLYIDNFEGLMKRSVQLTRTVNADYTKNSQDESYINPLTTNNAKLQDFIKGNDTTHNDVIEVGEKAYGYFKSNPEIMQAALKIENIYLQAIEEFEILFLGVY